MDNLFDNHPFPEFVITNDPFERTMIKANNKERDINKRLFNIDSKYNNLMIQFGDGFLKKSNHIHMNKSDLKKLSKSELIKLLLKKEKKKPEIVLKQHKRCTDVHTIRGFDFWKTPDFLQRGCMTRIQSHLGSLKQIFPECVRGVEKLFHDVS